MRIFSYPCARTGNPAAAEAYIAAMIRGYLPERAQEGDLAEALKDLGTTGRAGLSAAGDAAKALRILVAADISLARSAFGRALALTAVAIAFGASAWLLLMAALIAVRATVGACLASSWPTVLAAWAAVLAASAATGPVFSTTTLAAVCATLAGLTSIKTVEG